MGHAGGQDTMESGFGWFVGLDWGTAQHAVHVSTAAGDLVAERMVPHTQEGLQGLAAWLRELAGGQLERVAVAIEVPRGAVVETLLEQGAAVFSVNPKQLDRFRDRFSVAGAKDDRLDAQVLGSSLRTDPGRYRRLRLDEPLVIQVRELVRARETLQEEVRALTNRLLALVHRIAPHWLALCPAADARWYWDVLALATQAGSPRGLRRSAVAKVLTRHRIRAQTPDTVLAVLREPLLTVAPGTVEAVTGHIQLLLPRVRLGTEQVAVCERALEAALTALARSEAPPPAAPADDPPSADADTSPRPSAPHAPPVVEIVRSLPGAGLIVTATLVADAWHQLRTADGATLRTTGGAAPVRRQTGKRRALVTMRYACSHRLRQAFYHLARISVQHDAAARAYYAALRARGHSHARALRSVADRWIRILTAMLRTRTLYSPAVTATP